MLPFGGIGGPSLCLAPSPCPGPCLARTRQSASGRAAARGWLVLEWRRRRAAAASGWPCGSAHPCAALFVEGGMDTSNVFGTVALPALTWITGAGEFWVSFLLRLFFLVLCSQGWWRQHSSAGSAGNPTLQGSA